MEGSPTHCSCGPHPGPPEVAAGWQSGSREIAPAVPDDEAILRGSVPPKPATRLPLFEKSPEHVEKSLRVPTYLRNRPFGS
jgi:hypothetical protein